MSTIDDDDARDDVRSALDLSAEWRSVAAEYGHPEADDPAS